MMAYIHTIEDDCGNEVAEIITTHDVYVLPDGTQMTVYVVPVWCWKCRAFVAAESLESPESMEDASRRFFEHSKNQFPIPFDVISKTKQEEMRQSLLEKGLHKAAQWRIALADRISPARCLECSSPDFVEVPADNSWLSHPGDAGRKVRISTGISHASMASNGRRYDTEGWRIEEPEDQE